MLAVDVSLASAAVTAAVVVGLVSLARSLIEGDMRERIKVAVCLVIGIGAVWLVGASDFGHTEIILEKSLDSLNFWSQLLLGVLVAGVASSGWQVLKAIKNVGDNQP